MIEAVLDRASVAFAGAVLALLLAEYGFGAKGLARPEDLAYGGLVLSAGALGVIRMNRGVSSTEAEHARRT